nr:immunoglobulin heavy chain junction region [Macaca mulatta]
CARTQGCRAGVCFSGYINWGGDFYFDLW